MAETVRQNWLLFVVLGAVAVIAFLCFVTALINLRKATAPRPSPRDDGSAYPGQEWAASGGQGLGPWAREMGPPIGGGQPISGSYPAGYGNTGGGGGTPGALHFGGNGGTPEAQGLNGGTIFEGNAAGMASMNEGQGGGLAGGIPPIPPFPVESHGADTPPPPRLERPLVAEPAAVAMESVAPVEQPVVAGADQEQPSNDWGNTVWQGAPERSAEVEGPVADDDVYLTGDDERTLEGASQTLTVLPAYLEVVASGDPDRDQIGTRKKLYSLNNNPDFVIARPVNGQEAIANFIPLQSKRVSRNWEKQGKIVFEFGSGTYALLNLANPLHADPSQRNMPLRLEGRPMEPGEKVTLRDGDRIQIGDVMLRFHVSTKAPATFAPHPSEMGARGLPAAALGAMGGGGDTP